MNEWQIQLEEDLNRTADQSRDCQLQDAGVILTDRIMVEDTDEATTLDRFVEHFLLDSLPDEPVAEQRWASLRVLSDDPARNLRPNRRSGKAHQALPLGSEDAN